MTKFFYLSTCSTCQRIIKELAIDGRIPMQDIKSDQLTEDQIDQMAEIAGSYEALFSKRAMKYGTMGLKGKDLDEQDLRKLILDEYTFLKRPVLILEGQIFVGNAASTVAAAKVALA